MTGEESSLCTLEIAEGEGFGEVERLLFRDFTDCTSSTKEVEGFDDFDSVVCGGVFEREEECVGGADFVFTLFSVTVGIGPSGIGGGDSYWAEANIETDYSLSSIINNK